MSQSALSDDFMRWLAASPYAWRQDDDRDEFYEAPGGEVRFYLGRREDVRTRCNRLVIKRVRLASIIRPV